jgi:hypothetical protein
MVKQKQQETNQPQWTQPCKIKTTPHLSIITTLVATFVALQRRKCRFEFALVVLPSSLKRLVRKDTLAGFVVSEAIGGLSVGGLVSPFVLCYLLYPVESQCAPPKGFLLLARLLGQLLQLSRLARGGGRQH